MRALRTATRPPPGGLCTGGRNRAREHGFTLVELMMVMMLIAIVTAMSAARFADREPFAVQGAADQLVTGLRLAGHRVAQPRGACSWPASRPR
jgi:prepilin-type N-terminal cleavage/methylation domain-containing protein